MSSRLASLGVSVFCALGLGPNGFGQNLVVTAMGHHGAPANLTGDDISVEVNHTRASVCDWSPLRGDRSGLQLYIVIDDSTDTSLGLQFRDLKAFISEQPQTTKIGLAYLRNGEAIILVPLTADHEAVAGALRLPTAQPGISASPYMGISDLVKKWPLADVRREILYIGSGIDPYSPRNPLNLYLQNAIEDSQRAGILVNSIYYGEAGRLGHSWLLNWGQNYLAEIAEGTGGKAYYQGLINPVSLAPLLNEFAERLDHQYLLTVDVDAHKKGLEPVHVTTARAGVSISAASKIYFPG